MPYQKSSSAVYSKGEQPTAQRKTACCNRSSCCNRRTHGMRNEMEASRQKKKPLQERESGDGWRHMLVASGTGGLLSPVPEATVDWSPTLERWWLLFFGDHSVQSRRSGEGYLPADLLKCLCPHGCLEMLRPTGCATRCEQANDGWKSHITRHSDHLVCLLIMWEKLCFRRPSLNAPKQGPEPLGLRSGRVGAGRPLLGRPYPPLRTSTCRL